MSTAVIKATTVRMDESLKNQATELLDSLGLGFNAYLTLAVKQLVNQRRIPFDIVSSYEAPNEDTRRAMVMAEGQQLGLFPDDAPSFENTDELMAFLDED